MICVAELIELQIAVLPVRITCDGLQSAEQQCLSHHAQVLTQRVHDLHALAQRHLLQFLVVRNARQRVVQYLVESLCRQLLGYLSAQQLRVGFHAVRQTRVQFLRELHIVIPVDTQNIFHYVALALYIYPVPRHAQLPAVAKLLYYFNLQSLENRLDRLLADSLTDQAVHSLNIDRHLPRRKRFLCTLYIVPLYICNGVGDIHCNSASCYFLDQQRRALEHVHCVVRIASALVAERSIRLQLVSAAGLADRHGIEISALQEHVLRSFRHAALQTSEHTGNTHRLLLVGDHQVAGIHLALNAIEGYEFLALLGITHVDLIAFDLVGVKRMQCLTALVQHEVRYVHDVIDWPETDS